MQSIFKTYFQEWKEEKNNFLKFVSSYKKMILLLAVVMLYCYGMRLFYYDISIDSEIALDSQSTMTLSWIGINRFGLWLTKKIFMINTFVPYASNFLMILFLGCSAFTFCYCIWQWNGKNEKYKLFYYVFPLLYVTAPIFAEQFNFALQGFEIAWATFLCILSAYFTGKWIFLKKSILWMASGVLLMIWALGSYQAFSSLYIAVVLISFMLYYQNEDFSGITTWFGAGLKHAAVFVISFIGYTLATKLITAYFNLDSSYVNNMFLWKVDGIKSCIFNILGDALRIYFSAWPLFFRRAFLPAMLAAVILLLYRGWKCRKKEYWIFVIASLLLMLSPLFLSIVSGNYQPIRGQLVYPLLLAFVFAYLTTINKKVVSYVLLAASLYVALGQGQSLTRLFHTSHFTYESDKELAGDVHSRIAQVGADRGMQEYPVVFIGAKSIQKMEDTVDGDVIGHSFFEWDQAAYAGSTERIVNLCKSLGYGDLYMPSQEQVEFAQEYSHNMPVWPATGSVQVLNDFVVIKLSENT
ncbi:MAG TPA: glucosyltransferase domain-containing protein [Candidatus Pelethocola excrementipullorum]|nr:glucosyltransferase domain-containing protein [Candidatus Pelethocola excrementipullorum]